MPGAAETVIELEQRLMSPEVRGDRGELERLLADDFSEIGSSGRMWSRDEVIEELVARPSPSPVEVSDLVARRLATDVVLVTYGTVISGSAALRSSVWCREADQWRCVFHQGTPVARRGGLENA